MRQGFAYLNFDFFTKAPTAIGEAGGGVAPAIQGTIVLVGLAALFGGPPGIFTGIYLAEIGRGRFADMVRFLVDMLTGIPTIIFGLFAWVLIVVPSHGFSAYSGGVALGIIMIPTVARTTEDVLRLVPAELREASAALGATQSRTILRVVLPAARSGIATGFILAIARVAGETAPLLMTAFGSPFFFTSLNRPVAALPLQVYRVYPEPLPGANQSGARGGVHPADAGRARLACGTSGNRRLYGQKPRLMPSLSLCSLAAPRCGATNSSGAPECPSRPMRSAYSA